MRPGISIRLRLFALSGILLAAVAIVESWVGYTEMRSSAIAATASRLEGLATQWARALVAGRVTQLAVLRSVGEAPAVRALVAEPNQDARLAAAEAIQRLLKPEQSRAGVQILDAGFNVVLETGRPGVWADSASRIAFLRAVVPADSGLTGKLHAFGDSILYPIAARIDGGERVLGIVLEWRRVAATREAREQVIRLFGGGITRILLANRVGDVWTDLGGRVPSVNVDLQGTAPLSYHRAGAEAMIASAHPVSGTPWTVIMESPRAEALTQARHFLRRTSVIAAFAIALGLLGAWAVSVSITGPISRLTRTAEALASGSHGMSSFSPTRGDEVGRLAATLDSMLARLQGSVAERDALAEHYRQLFDSVPLPLWVVDRQTYRFLAVNAAAINHYGYSREEFLGMTASEIRPRDDIPRMREEIHQAEQQFKMSGGWTHLRKDGTPIQVETQAHSLTFNGIDARIVVVHDVTERLRAARARRQLEERYRTLIQNAPNGVTLIALDGRFLSANPALVQMLGYGSEEEIVGLNAWERYAQPDQRTSIAAKIRETGAVHRETVQLTREDGKVIIAQFSGRIVTDPENGERYVEAVLEDVTEQRRLEQQIQQSQRMEAVGRLAGGVAHDFNNLLTVILGEVELIELERQPLNRSTLHEIKNAAERAVGLTRQLLAFSRRQVIEPSSFRLSDPVTDITKMLDRLIGENITIVKKFAADTGVVRADRGQIEQVLTNLAVNARDAMPLGGTLCFETSNVTLDPEFAPAGDDVPPGDYVLLSVSDTGTGMTDEVKARVFEPFFTTKEPGKGTGLGLATCYGIVKQNGGHIAVYSELGLGTTFRIYLPMVADESTRDSARPRGDLPRGDEVILLVEDEDSVRKITSRILAGLGYQVLQARDGNEALEIAGNSNGIDLLLTDVVMPRMGGRELAETALAMKPGLKVLFSTGYTDDMVLHHKLIERGVKLILKPFTRESLARKIREVLDE